MTRTSKTYLGAVLLLLFFAMIWFAITFKQRAGVAKLTNDSFSILGTDEETKLGEALGLQIPPGSKQIDVLLENDLHDARLIVHLRFAPSHLQEFLNANSALTIPAKTQVGVSALAIPDVYPIKWWDALPLQPSDTMLSKATRDEFTLIGIVRTSGSDVDVYISRSSRRDRLDPSLVALMLSGALRDFPAMPTNMSVFVRRFKR